MILRFTMEDFTKILDEERRRDSSRDKRTCLTCRKVPTLNTEKERKEFERTELCQKCQEASYSEVVS